MSLNFPPADCSVPSSNETQNSDIDGAGNGASNPVGSMAAPDSTLTLTDSYHAHSFPEHKLASLPLASTNYYPRTSSNDHPSYPIYPRLAPNELIDDPYNGTAVPPMQKSTPPVPLSMPHGYAERLFDAGAWLNTGAPRDGVALMKRIAHQLGLQIHMPHALPPVSRVPPKLFPNSSTTHPDPTLASSAQTNDPFPVRLVGEQPQCLTGTLTTHPSTTHPSAPLGEFGGNWASAPLFVTSEMSPHGNSGLQQPPSSSLSFNYGATPAFHPGTSPHSAVPHCEISHVLQPFTRVHDTNPLPSTQRFSASNKVQKPGRCSQCLATNTSQWRRHPDTKLQLCNRCGQKAHGKKRNA
ncbi:hypothetical protein B0H11DRAFT_2194865 [Mycena galericulata]|nr:hypothetical protein B0H11DRAFT_2194865 [Mycena galericulata]